MTKVAMMGGGSWGTAFALVLAEAGSNVTLWTRSETVATDINELHRNSRYHPGVDLPASLVATTDPRSSPRWRRNRGLSRSSAIPATKFG